MKRPWAIALIFIAGIVLGVGGVLVATAGNDSGDNGTSVNTKNASKGGTASANELLNRLGRGSKATYHVRYAAGSEAGAHAVLDVWHKNENTVRRDVTATSSTGET